MVYVFPAHITAKALLQQKGCNDAKFIVPFFIEFTLLYLMVVTSYNNFLI